MRAENILVTGATGKVGTELVRRLLEAGVEVKAGTRDPERGRKLFGNRAEVVELNYFRTETYDAALTWADRVFLMPPPFSPDAHEAIGGFLDWSVSVRVRQIVLLSGMTVPEMDDLALRKVELHLAGQDVPGVVLRPNLYMQNFHPGFISRQISEAGSIRVPAGDGRVSLVDVRDVAAVAARLLTTADPTDEEITLTGPEALSMAEAAELLSRHAGLTIEYEPASQDEFRQLLQEDGWREGEVEVVLGLFRSIREGSRAPVSDAVAERLGRPARSFAAFAEEAKGVWS